MPGFLWRGVFAAAGLWIATYFLRGLWFDTPATLVIAGLTLGLVNAFLRPILVILTLQATIVTLGLFLLVLNGAMVALVGHFLHGMHVGSFSTAILAALIVSVVSFIGQELFRR
jgi:putative membrane protein